MATKKRPAAAKKKTTKRNGPAKKSAVPAKKRAAKRNGSAAAASAAAFEGFHGRPATKQIEIKTRERQRLHLADIGELVELEVLTGQKGFAVVLSGFRGARLAMSPNRTQLFVEGGDQRVSLEKFGVYKPYKDLEVLGPVRSVKYYTVKDHLGDEGGEANYHHHFGEDGGKLPFLLYDTLNGRLQFAGGDYGIPDEGIED